MDVFMPFIFLHRVWSLADGSKRKKNDVLYVCLFVCFKSLSVSLLH